MFLVFSGTSDCREKLLDFLYSHEIKNGFTGVPTYGSWQGKRLYGDMLIFFDREDAEKTQSFLLKQCGQIEAPIIHLAVL